MQGTQMTVDIRGRFWISCGFEGVFAGSNVGPSVNASVSCINAAARCGNELPVLVLLTLRFRLVGDWRLMMKTATAFLVCHRGLWK